MREKRGRWDGAHTRAPRHSSDTTRSGRTSRWVVAASFALQAEVMITGDHHFLRVRLRVPPRRKLLNLVQLAAHGEVARVQQHVALRQRRHRAVVVVRVADADEDARGVVVARCRVKLRRRGRQARGDGGRVLARRRLHLTRNTRSR